MNGPIEFLGESTGQTRSTTEYGGGSGLIQGSPHQMTASEANSAMMRAAMYRDDAEDGPVVDPATGLEVPMT